jgi:hypothetical protein
VLNLSNKIPPIILPIPIARLNTVTIGGNDGFKYAIQGNKIVWVLADGSQNVWDILKLDASTFIMRYDYKDETGLASVVLTYSKTKN